MRPRIAWRWSLLILIASLIAIRLIRFFPPQFQESLAYGFRLAILASAIPLILFVLYGLTIGKAKTPHPTQAVSGETVSEETVSEETVSEEPISDIDREIIELWRAGKSAKEIARSFLVEPETINNRISALRKQYGEEVVPYRKRGKHGQ